MRITEADWEAIALDALAEREWSVAHGTDLTPGKPGGRKSWSDIVLDGRVKERLRELNPLIPGEYVDQAVEEILTAKSQDAMAENRRIHDYLVNGYRGISYIDADGREQNPTIRLVSHIVHENEWLAANQITIRNREGERRFDLVLYLNGLPVSIIELKQAGKAKADLAAAQAQLTTYLREFPLAFRSAVLTVISDGITARYGTPFTPLNHYARWNVDDEGKPMTPGESIDDYKASGLELEYLLDGVFNPERFLQLMRNFTAFDEGGEGFLKRIAKPHQYFAVSKAVGSTIQAVESNGKAGVVWHTQGSGKSMEMELYANLVSRHPKLKNPTIIVITDRKELDGQLFETFKRSTLLPSGPIQIRDRATLRRELSGRTTGGIYFTTLQKFGKNKLEKESGSDHPLLSDRRNVIVMVDEAHRSHYDDLDGYARHLQDALPNATLIAFTGTPISFADRNTRDVFGDYIDIYDLTRAVEDGATVPVYFEPRLAQVGLGAGVTEEDLDAAADEATDGLDEIERHRAEQAVAVINAVYGAPSRITRLATDIIDHWERRSKEMVKFIGCAGKAMIVGGTREICANLYAEIIKQRPDWHDDAVDKGRIKVVYSGDATDQPPVSEHVRREGLNKTIKARLRDPKDELQIVIVKDMMLTGYDSPPMHTLYLDRPLKGALLMQTLARVNRTFRSKQDGLLVAYAPLVENLEKALAEYTATDQSAKPLGKDIDEAVAATRQLLDELRDLCAAYDWRRRLDGSMRAQAQAVAGMTNFLRDPRTPGNHMAEGEQSRQERFRARANHLARMWAVASGSSTLADRLGEAQFYEEVRVWMAKLDAQERQASGQPIPDDVQRILAELVNGSTAAGGIVDIYQAAGLERPSLSELRADYAEMAQRATNPHLAIEALRATLTEEATNVTRNNIIRQRAFSERLKELMNRYTNQQLTSAEVIAELAAMANDIAHEGNRGQRFDPPLDSDELAFYDAVSTNDSARELQGDEVLAKIARDLVKVMRRDASVDWTVRDDVRAKLRAQVKRLLVRYKYPPDKQPEAISLVIEQMESMAAHYAD